MDKSPRLGFALTGSFCNHRAALDVMRTLAAGWDLVPILSFHAAKTDTRFGRAADLCDAVEAIAGRPPVTTIPEAERFGPSDPLDALLLCPAPGTRWQSSRTGSLRGSRKRGSLFPRPPFPQKERP